MANGPILSPDGKHVLVDGEWLEISQQNVSVKDSVITGDVSLESTVNINTRNPKEEIINLAELVLVKLKQGEVSTAMDIYTDAKKINVKIAQEVFLKDYG